MNIAIVDDNQQDRSELLVMLKRYCSVQNVGAQYIEISSGEAFLSCFSPNKFQIVFLDIYMEKMGGMEVARKIYAEDPNCHIIFTTLSHAHAVESYQVRASYYLTKPIEYSSFCNALDTIGNTIFSDTRCLDVTIDKVKTSVLYKDILYVDSIARNTRIHLEHKTLNVSDKLIDIETALKKDTRFLSCNRNITINMDWVAEIPTENFLLKNGERVPIRQRGKTSVKKTFLVYSLKGLRNGETL